MYRIPGKMPRAEALSIVSTLKIVVHRELTFEAIYTCHSQLSHFKKQKTFALCKTKYENIPLKYIDLFIKLCPTRNHTTGKNRRKQKGAVKPIDTWAVRDRFQVDLIDFQSDPALLYPSATLGPANPTMRWLLVVKDHFSRFVWTIPIPRKEASIVAAELTRLFRVVGFPIILQTDNGSEFGHAVFLAIKKANPTVFIVKSR